MGSASAPQASAEGSIISTQMAAPRVASPIWSDLVPPGGMDLGRPTERSAPSRARVADSGVVEVGASLLAGVGRHSNGRIGHELAVFDPAVPDLASLLLGLREGVHAMIIDPRHEPLAQSADAAAQRAGLAALRIIAHGAPGQIRLVSQAVALANLAAEDKALRRLSDTNAATGAVSFKAAPNLELPTDVGANNVCNITVTASDVSLRTAQTVVMTVANFKAAPVITSGATASFAENGTNPTSCQPAPPCSPVTRRQGPHRERANLAAPQCGHGRFPC